MAEVWGDLPAMKTIRNSALAVMEDQDVGDRRGLRLSGRGPDRLDPACP
ncbi:MAG: hypothetical protein M5U19_19975 [Microthrixaceae bacterium]|nr:hypothetical protein [Microthrixaceae bacterium]